MSIRAQEISRVGRDTVHKVSRFKLIEITHIMV